VVVWLVGFYSFLWLFVVGLDGCLGVGCSGLVWVWIVFLYLVGWFLWMCFVGLCLWGGLWDGERVCVGGGGVGFCFGRAVSFGV